MRRVKGTLTAAQSEACWRGVSHAMAACDAPTSHVLLPWSELRAGSARWNGARWVALASRWKRVQISEASTPTCRCEQKAQERGSGNALQRAGGEEGKAKSQCGDGGEGAQRGDESEEERGRMSAGERWMERGVKMDWYTC